MAITLVVTAIAVGLGLVVIHNSQAKVIYQQLYDENLANANMLADVVSAAVLFQDTTEIRRELEIAGKARHLQHVMVYDRQGSLLASFHHAQAQFPPEKLSNNAAVMKIGTGLHFWVPVVSLEDTLGTLYYAVSLAPMHSLLTRELTTFLLMGVFSLFLVYLGISLLYPLAVDPLTKLADTTRKIAIRHDYSKRLPPYPVRDEVGRLYEDFNELLNQLEAREKVRNKLLEQLREALQRNEALLRAIPDVLFVIDEQWTIKEAWVSEIRFPGLESLGNIEGKKITDFPLAKPDLVAQFQSLFRTAMETRSMKTMEFTIDINNRDLHLEARLVPLTDSEVMVMVRDVTALRKAQKGMQRQAERTRILSEIASELNNVTTRKQLHTIAIEGLRRLLRADAGMLIWQTGSHEWRLIEVNNVGTELGEKLAANFSVESTHSPSNPIVIEDLGAISDPTSFQELLRAAGWQSVFLLGLEGKNYFACLIALFAAPRRFYADELTAAEVLVDNISHTMARLSFIRELQNREQHYRQLAARSIVGMAVFTPSDQRLQFVNPRMAEITGHTIDELQSEKRLWEGFLSPEDQELVAENMRRSFQGKDVPPYIISLTRKDGKHRWVQISHIPIEFEGQPAFQLQIQDLTELFEARWELEKHLQRSELLREATEQLNQSDNQKSAINILLQIASELLESEKYAILLKTGDNAGAETQFASGISSKLLEAIKEEVTRVSLLTDENLVEIKDLKHSPFKWTTNRSLKREGIRSLVIIPIDQHFPPDSWLLEAFSEEHKLTSEEKNALKMLVDSFRITILRLEQLQAIRASEAKYRDVVETSRDIIFQTDRRGRWTLLNPSWQEILGYDLAESLGKDSTQYAHDEDKEALSQAWQELLTERKSFIRMDFRFVSQDNQILWLRCHARPAKNSVGEITGITGTLSNITLQRQAREALLRHRQQLEEEVARRTAELESFTYSVSHDLKSPLRAIDGFANILLKDYHTQLDSEGQRLLQIIIKNVRHMANLINDLLALSRVGRRDLSIKHQDMNKLVSEVIKEHQGNIGSRKLEWRVQELPPALADVNTIRQVWTNLIGNAVKFTSKREFALIEIGGKEESEHVIYWVRDNGTGFDMRYANKLFGVFQRLHHQSDFPGTGVGLAIVKRILERHNGRIWAEAEENKGATFFFTLPKKPSHPRDQNDLL